ncbi:Rossmann-like and DUF2520 domain-containing protein [Sungkyunkwania multivorans]|uniref:Rossmann-like and DUF2520 domain-containing protein n=1 Tax=Sungkyunkwania multivorans TaxID=1173618 RepID=A0ABW3CX86_9FLAO
MFKTVIIGTGNVAFHLHKALKASNAVEVRAVSSRSDLAKLPMADVYIIAVSDDAVAKVSSEIRSMNALVVHTSGSVAMEGLASNNRKGVFYPLQTFSKEKDLDFKTIPICLEAEDEKDLQLLEKLAKAVSEKVYHIDSEQRKALHLAAVFVNNFVNHLYHIGSDICTEHDVPFEVLKPLIQETAEKVVTLSPKQAQTGPAKRNDLETIKKHVHSLSNSTYRKIYELLTNSISNTYGGKEL